MLSSRAVWLMGDLEVHAIPFSKSLQAAGISFFLFSQWNSNAKEGNGGS